MFSTFVILLLLLKLCKSSNVDDICAFIEDCGSSPCDCVSDDDPHCMECTGGQGCQQCELGYFQARNDQKCVDCSLLIGCTSCQQEIGCAMCNSTQGCTREKSDLCDVWACDCPTDAPTGSPSNVTTPSPSSSPTTLPTPGPSSSPTTVPSVSPSSSPTTLPSVSPTGNPSNFPSKQPTSEPSPSPTETISERFVILMDILYDDVLGDIFEQFGDNPVVCIGDDCGGVELFVYFGFASACDQLSERNFVLVLPSEVTNRVLYSFCGLCKDTEFGAFWLNGLGYVEYDDNGKIVRQVEHYDGQESTFKVSQLLVKGKLLAGNETNFDNFP